MSIISQSFHNHFTITLKRFSSKDSIICSTLIIGKTETMFNCYTSNQWIDCFINDLKYWLKLLMIHFIVVYYCICTQIIDKTCQNSCRESVPPDETHIPPFFPAPICQQEHIPATCRQRHGHLKHVITASPVLKEEKHEFTELSWEQLSSYTVFPMCLGRRARPTHKQSLESSPGWAAPFL